MNPLLELEISTHFYQKWTESEGRKINKVIVKLNNITSWLDIVDIYRVFHPTVTEYTFFSSSHGTSWATGRPYLFKIIEIRDFPNGTVVKTLPFNAGDVGLIPGHGAKIPHASRLESQAIKQNHYCNNYNKYFKNGPH